MSLPSFSIPDSRPPKGVHRPSGSGPNELKPVADFFRRFLAETGCALRIVHHDTKQQQGKQDEAQQLLAPLYSWFTEGFDTADLQEAKALLGDETITK